MYKGINYVLIFFVLVLVSLLWRSCELNRSYVQHLESQDQELTQFKSSRRSDSSIIYTQGLVIKIKDEKLKKSQLELFALQVLKLKEPREVIRFKTKYVLKTEIQIAETEKIDSVNYLRVPVEFQKSERWFSLNGKINSSGTLLIDSLVTNGQFTYSVGDTVRKGLINRLFNKTDQVVRLHIDNPNLKLEGMSNIYIRDRRKWYQTTGFKVAIGVLLGFLGASGK